MTARTCIAALPDQVIGPPRAAIDEDAFAIAAVLTPAVFALSGLPVVGVGVVFTVGAALAGAPAYLLVGVPAAWLAISRTVGPDGRADLGVLMVAGLVVHLVSVLPMGLLIWLEGGSPQTIATYGALGMIAAPVQAAIFADIYRKVQRPRRIPSTSIELQRRPRCWKF